jgi:hypothetical protein
MSEENETTKAIEIVIMDKAERIIGSERHTNHISSFLDWRDINSDGIQVDVFKICAVDAMIYDVGAALDFEEFKGFPKRREMLEKIFPKK